jgi:hypothetical protein
MTLSPSAFQLWTGRFLSALRISPVDLLWAPPLTFCGDFRKPEPGVSLFEDVLSFFLPGITSESSIAHTCLLPTGGFLIWPAS